MSDQAARATPRRGAERPQPDDVHPVEDGGDGGAMIVELYERVQALEIENKRLRDGAAMNIDGMAVVGTKVRSLRNDQITGIVVGYGVIDYWEAGSTVYLVKLDEEVHSIGMHPAGTVQVIAMSRDKVEAIP